MSSPKEISKKQQKGMRSANDNNEEISSSSSSTRERLAKVALTSEEQAELFAKIPVSDRVSHCGLPFEGSLQECVICCKVSDLFGIGECMHHVCMECAIRMRVIGEHNNCPQCRGEIDMMYFVKSSADNDWNLKTMEFLLHADTVRYKIKFDCEFAKEAYDRYLSHNCKLCSKGRHRCVMPTFESLRNHYGHKHQMFFCHLCSENLRLFSWERKAYSRDSLHLHMKKGDKDDKSLKGHPQCLFCPDRFFDGEAQYKHLRLEHYFCQLCDAEGISNVFYKERKELNDHYGKTHHSCKDPECKRMGIVFRNDLELQLHVARTHNNNGGGRQVINLNFHYNDRQLVDRSRYRSPSPTTRFGVAGLPVGRPNPTTNHLSGTAFPVVSSATRTGNVPTGRLTNTSIVGNYARTLNPMSGASAPSATDFPSLHNSEDKKNPKTKQKNVASLPAGRPNPTTNHLPGTAFPVVSFANTANKTGKIQTGRLTKPSTVGNSARTLNPMSGASAPSATDFPSLHNSEDKKNPKTKQKNVASLPAGRPNPTTNHLPGTAFPVVSFANTANKTGKIQTGRLTKPSTVGNSARTLNPMSGASAPSATDFPSLHDSEDKKNPKTKQKNVGGLPAGRPNPATNHLSGTSLPVVSFANTAKKTGKIQTGQLTKPSIVVNSARTLNPMTGTSAPSATDFPSRHDAEDKKNRKTKQKNVAGLPAGRPNPATNHLSGTAFPVVSSANTADKTGNIPTGRLTNPSIAVNSARTLNPMSGASAPSATDFLSRYDAEDKKKRKTKKKNVAVVVNLNHLDRQRALGL